MQIAYLDDETCWRVQLIHSTSGVLRRSFHSDLKAEKLATNLVHFNSNKKHLQDCYFLTVQHNRIQIIQETWNKNKNTRKW